MENVIIVEYAFVLLFSSLEPSLYEASYKYESTLQYTGHIPDGYLIFSWKFTLVQNILTYHFFLMYSFRSPRVCALHSVWLS